MIQRVNNVNDFLEAVSLAGRNDLIIFNESLEVRYVPDYDFEEEFLKGLVEKADGMEVLKNG